MLASSQTKQRQSFLKVNNYNFSFGPVVLKINVYTYKNTYNNIYFFSYEEEKLSNFTNEHNNFHYNLKFTYKAPSYTVDFLDLNVSLRNSAIHVDLYIK